MRNYLNAFSQLDRNVWLFLFFWGMIGFGHFGVITVLFNLYLVRLDYGPEFIGRLQGSGQLVWAVFALPAGILGARIGLKRVLMAGMLTVSSAIPMLVAADALPPQLRSPGLVAAWMLSWIGASMLAVNGLPYLMGITSEETRGYAFSAQTIVLSLMALTGSLLAGALPGFLAGRFGWTLEQPMPYRLSLLLAPLAYLTGTLVFSRACPVETVKATGEHTGPSRAPLGIFLFMGMLFFLQSFSDGAVRSFFNVYLDTSLLISTATIGAVMGLAQLAPITFSFLTPWMLARWRSTGTLMVSTLASVLFILMIAGVPNWVSASLAFTGLAGVGAVIVSSRGIFSQEIVIPRWRTTISSISVIGLALGWAISSWLGGELAGAIGFQYVFLVGAVFALLSAVTLFGYLRFARRKRKPTPVPVQPVPVTGELGED